MNVMTNKITLGLKKPGDMPVIYAVQGKSNVPVCENGTV